MAAEPRRGAGGSGALQGTGLRPLGGQGSAGEQAAGCRC